MNTNKILNIYYNFVVNALVGRTQNSDAIMKEHKKEILKVASMLRDRFGYPKETLYRGILLEPKDVKNGILYPLDYIQTLSFTEDKSQAIDFANPNSFMSGAVMQMRPDSQGYIIKYKPKLQEILFYWKWAEALNLDKINILDINLIHKQKEVIIIQNMKKFKVIPLNKFL